MSAAIASLRTRKGALSIAVLVGVVLLLAASVPIVSLFKAQAEEIELATAELGRLRAEDSIRPVLQEQLRGLMLKTAALPALFSGKSFAAAQSQVQQTVEELVKSEGGSIRSTQILPAAHANAFDVIEIQYELTCSMSKLAGLIYGIESHEPSLFLRDVQIAGGDLWASRGPDKDDDTGLNIRWIVRAYRWRGLH